MHLNLSICSTNLLTQKQQEETADLTAVCHHHDQNDLSYPLEETDVTHFLAYLPDGSLAACLALIPYEEDLAECCAFTHPDFRNQGIFSRLLEEGLSHIPDSDLLFAVSESCQDTVKTLAALGAEKESEELMMECDLTSRSCFHVTQTAAASASPSHSPSITSGSFSLHQTSASEFCLYQGDLRLGTAFAEPVREGTVCLHHVEILPEYRHQGLGTVFFTLLLPALASQGFQPALLQVAGDNMPAIALYKKTGFSVTKTLSYYFY